MSIKNRTVLLLIFTLLNLQIVACNAKSIIGIAEISQKMLLSQIENQQSPLIIDVRSAAEYDAGHIPGAINIEFRQLTERINEISSFKNSTVVVYCERGIRAKVADNTLKKAGFQSILHLEGNMSAWRSNSLPIEKS